MPRLTFLHGLGDVAVRYGVDESIFLHVVVSLAINNKDNNRNFRDGRWWTYNSLSAWEQEFPWWSAKQIRRIISSCKEQGALFVGEYNKDPRDRTSWYSPSDELLGYYRESWQGKCECPNGQMHEPDGARDCAQTGMTIPKESQKSLSKNIYAHLDALHEILSGFQVADDDRASNAAVLSRLEEHGYLCQNEVPVPSRGDSGQYTGRIGIVATKDGTVIAIETDRKSIRKKSLYKLRDYPCDARVVLLRDGECTEPPEGIDAVISLKLGGADDLFHEFWDTYPKKVDKRRAFEVFKRLKVSRELLSAMLNALEQQKRSQQWKEANGQYIPHAATWLNGRRWEDQIEPPDASAWALQSGVPTW